MAASSVISVEVPPAHEEMTHFEFSYSCTGESRGDWFGTVPLLLCLGSYVQKWPSQDFVDDGAATVSSARGTVRFLPASWVPVICHPRCGPSPLRLLQSPGQAQPFPCGCSATGFSPWQPLKMEPISSRNGAEMVQNDTLRSFFQVVLHYSGAS